MKHIRRGNDIHIRWAVTVNDGKIKLSDANLTVELRDERGRLRQMPYEITDGRVIDFDFYGVDQTVPGKYAMILWLDKGKHGQAVLDQQDAFFLVDKTRETGGLLHNSNIEVETVEFSSEMVIGIQGKDGKSAYEVAVENGYVGTRDMWLHSLQGNPGKDGKDGLTTAVKANGKVHTQINGVVDLGNIGGQTDIGLSVVDGKLNITYNI